MSMEEAGWRSTPQNQPTANEIDQMRTAIDALDESIANLLQQRLKLACQIGQLKATSGLAVKDAARENLVLEKVASVADNCEIGNALANIYRSVISEACALQNAIAANRSDEPATIDGVGYFPNVTIVGVGLIGASLARQIKRRMPGTVITGVDRPEVLDKAAKEGLIDEGLSDASSAISQAGLILLCASPQENLRLLAEMAPRTRRRQVILDVTSTKQEICALANKLSMKADFVGGHPLFGSHRSGLEGSADVCVEGARFCLVNAARCSELTLRRIARWLGELGLQVVHVEAEAHDASLAETSHLVQLVAVAVGSAIAAPRTKPELRNVLQLSGPALQQLSRLMASPPEMWLQIIKQNRNHILRALDNTIASLKRLQTAVADGDDNALRAEFAEAARVRTAIEQMQ
jgi:prephenate dehydrogenase/chorismate mutase